MKNMTHAVVLDNHQLFADSFALLLQHEGIADIAQGFSNIDDFYRFFRIFGRMEIYVFLDYYFSSANGLAIMVEAKRINNKAKFIFVSSLIAPSVIRGIKQYHPHGILSKYCDASMLTTCFDMVKIGKQFVAPELEALLSGTDADELFTPRELELLVYFNAGFSIAETANKTFLSPHTVVAHRRKMMLKAKCNSIGQLLTYARSLALI